MVVATATAFTFVGSGKFAYAEKTQTSTVKITVLDLNKKILATTEEYKNSSVYAYMENYKINCLTFSPDGTKIASGYFV